MLVSVIMPVYNSVQFLRESINSVLHQTHTDFEFIILNDGSSEPVQEILESIEDSRVKIFRNHNNLGLTKSLNICLDKVHGDFVMRHDGDDISLPTRMEEQLSWFEKDVGFVTCWYNSIVLLNGLWGIKPQKYRMFPADLIGRYTTFNNGCDPGTMYSIEAVRKIGYFDARLYISQTYNYNRRIQQFFEGRVVPKVLYLLREWNGRVTKRFKVLDDNGQKINWHKLANKYARKYPIIHER